MEEDFIKQYHAILMARYEMSQLEQQLIYRVFCQLEEGQPEDQQYLISMKEVEREIAEKITPQVFQRTTLKMLSRSYTIENFFPSVENGRNFHIFSLFTGVLYREDGYLEITLAQGIRPFMLFLKQHFSPLQLHIAFSLRTKYSSLLYDLLSPYKARGTMQLSLEGLKDKLGLIDSQTGQEQYKDWSAFAAHVLETSKRELAAHTDLHFSYETIKVRKKVVALKFRIKNQALALLRNFRQPSPNPFFPRQCATNSPQIA